MYQVLPLALQYGMTPEQFWNGDKRLFYAYEKAYYNTTSYNAWLNGLYINNALECLAHNILSDKGSKKVEYFKIPIDIYSIVKSNTSDNIEDIGNKNQNLLSNQNRFIEDIIKGKKEK